MTDAGRGPGTPTGSVRGDALALSAIVAILAVPLAPALLLSDGSAAIVVSSIGTLLNTILLLGLFSSVLYKGVGPRRSLWTILLIAVIGIGAMLAHFANLYRWTGLHAPGGAATQSFYDAFYFSVVTWTTLGYGDFLPAPDARIIVIVEALLGYLMMALLIAALISSIAKSTPQAGERP